MGLSFQEANAVVGGPGSPFEVIDVERDGVTNRTFKNAPSDLRQLFETARGIDETFIVYEDEDWTFAEVMEEVDALSHALVHHYGVKPGDRVGIAMRNYPEWIISFAAILSIGAISVSMNAWWTGQELEYAINDAQLSVLIGDTERIERGADACQRANVRMLGVRLDKLAPLAPNVEHWHDVVVRGVAMPEVELSADMDATILYTSGTTGHPKGAVGTHRNAITNLMNLFFVGSRATMRFGAGNFDESGESIPNAALLSVPLFHATGCLATMITATASGGKLVMMHHFDAGQALALIESERLTMFGGVPTIAMQILDHRDFAKFDTSSVKSVSYGGAPAPPELVRRIQAAFPGGQPGNGYGLTETSAAVCLNSGADYLAKPDSCGPAMPVVELAIVPEDFDGDEPSADLPRGPGVVGELWIKGPNVVRGYWNKPEATAKAFTKGWLRSGDIARIDEEGFVFIVDRAKDMIIRGGENVYSVIVEAAIFEHPDVADCAVVGLPHTTMGEEVAAVIVLRPGHVLEAEEINRHVARHLARFEMPTRIFFRAEPLPRNPQGKVLKRELRASLVEEIERSA